MDNTSGGGGGLSPVDAARMAERNVGIGGEAEELDRQREALRLEVAQLYQGAAVGMRDLSLGVQEYDFHLMVKGLRRLLSIGYLAKPLADQVEGLLPQPSRLFDPIGRG